MSEKEVELLLFDEGFLANRDVWNACESLEIQVCVSVPQPLLNYFTQTTTQLLYSKAHTRTQFLRMMEDQTEELNSLADKRARAHFVVDTGQGLDAARAQVAEVIAAMRDPARRPKRGD